jgi:predicted nucleotidyltransferase
VPLEFDRVLRSLIENQVEFVIVGLTAAIAQGAPLGTVDLDICYQRTQDNADRLATALKPFHPRPRGAPEGLPLKLDSKTIMMGSNFTFVTDAGDVDILGHISGVGEYQDMRQNAVETEAFGLSLLVMSLEDVIKSKKAAGRKKDKAQLPVLEETLRLRRERAKDL